VSWEAWGTPEDDVELPEGAISEDVVEKIRTLLEYIDYPEIFPRPGNKSDAALILIEQEINPPRVGKVEDPMVTWAKTLMKDVV
jgi:hypothetical protein